MSFLKYAFFSILFTLMGLTSFLLLARLSPVNDRLPAALKSLNDPLNLLPKNKSAKSAPPLWSCGCANMTEKAQATHRCSKGFVFNSMTAASAYARQKCGEECIPDCHAKNLDPEAEDSIDL
jgi:hypothetical protein